MRPQRRPLFIAGVVFALIASACGTEGGERTTAPPASNAVIVDGDFGPDDMMALLYRSKNPSFTSQR